MFNFFKKLFSFKTNKSSWDPYNLGILQEALPDDVAVKFEEIVKIPNSVDWKPLDISKLPDYPVRNQDGSGGCVAFTINFIASIFYFFRTGIWVDFSSAWTYSHRANKNVGDGQGMYSLDAFGLGSTIGFLPDDLLPSDNINEDKLSNPKLYPWFNAVAESFRLDGSVPIFLRAGDIDALASVIQTTGKPVMVWFRFAYDEWGKVPKVLTDNPPYGHSVTAIPPQKTGEMTVGTYNGENAIVIQDSWGKLENTFNGKRIITRSFYKARNLLAAYPMRFKFDVGAGGKPKYDGSIVSLQDCLKYEGVFPSNVSSTGTFGPVTKGAVVKFQAKYSIQQTGTVGPITAAKLKELYPMQ